VLPEDDGEAALAGVGEVPLGPVEHPLVQLLWGIEVTANWIRQACHVRPGLRRGKAPADRQPTGGKTRQGKGPGLSQAPPAPSPRRTIPPLLGSGRRR
jgi:hypothetical protein